MMYKGTFLLLSVLSFLAAIHGARDICCKLSGNGNYKQFDNPPSVHFRSDCVYNFASDINGVFQIWVDPEFHKDNPKVSFAQSTIIHYGGETYYLNHTEVQLPDGTVAPIQGFPTQDDGIIRIESIGDNIKFTIIPEEVDIFWHGAYNLKVCVGDQWRQNPSTMNGLCGNNNGDKTDDLVMSNGTVLTERNFETYNIFGESWNVTEWCYDEPPIKEWPCCIICGDPHETMPDGLQFKVNDVCTYDLILTQDGSLDISMLTVRHQNANTSWAKKILFRQKGGEYRLDHKSVNVNSIKVLPPYEDTEFDCYIDDHGRFCCDSVQVPMRICSLKPFCYEICFDHQFDGLVSGLCGNCNGNPDDDLITRQGENVNGVENGLETFINSWKVEPCPEE